MNPKVSVIIPTYNRGYIVIEAIESALLQTLEDIEVLVVDDGSTDNTKQIIESVSDVRLKYFYKDNGGVSSARNLGILKAGGDYIAFLDSDDTWPSEFLQLSLSMLDENPDYGLSYAATTCQYPDGTIKHDDITRCVSGNVTIPMFLHSTIWPTTVLVRRSAMTGIWFDEQLRVCEDHDAFLRLSIKTQFIFIEGITIQRRYSEDSLAAAAGIEGVYTRALSLERFYYRLGGNAIVPRSKAMKRLGNAYRRAGKSYLNKGFRKASIYFLCRAIKYRPFEIKAYIILLSALFKGKVSDKMPDWRRPDPLGEVRFGVTE